MSHSAGNSSVTATGERGRLFTGRVVSNRMQKTITVQIERQVSDPLYGKTLRRRTKLHAHDEKGQCGIGDLVEIRECRPLSRLKRFQLVRVVTKAVAAE